MKYSRKSDKKNCKIGFAGFGEVSTPKDIIVRKCAAALEILLPDLPAFAEKVLSQHYFIAYGDRTSKIKAFCKIQGIEII